MAYQNEFTLLFKRFWQVGPVAFQEGHIVYISTNSDCECAPNIIFQKLKIKFSFQEKLRKLALYSYSGDRQS